MIKTNVAEWKSRETHVFRVPTRTNQRTSIGRIYGLERTTELYRRDELSMQCYDLWMDPKAKAIVEDCPGASSL